MNCRVGRVVLENVRTRGVPPKELVHASSFNDINKDGRSTGRGVIEKIVSAPACGLGRAETTRELRDGKYWIDVPAMCSRPKSHPVSWLSCGEKHEENQR